MNQKPRQLSFPCETLSSSIDSSSKEEYQGELYKNKDWLYQKYIIEKMSISQIRKECNVSYDTIYYFLKKFKIGIRSQHDSVLLYCGKDPSIAKKTYRNKDWLYQKYCLEKLSTLKIARLCDCGLGTILRALKKFKIKIRSRREAGEIGRWKSKRREFYQNKGFLTEKYLVEKLTTREIAKLCEVEHRTIRVHLNKFNMPIRGRAEAQIGRVVPRETRKKLSKITKESWQNPEFVKKMLKSRERRLTKPEKAFDEMTPEIFRYVGNRAWWVKLDDGHHHNPDFKVSGQDKVIEIWGSYWHKNDDPKQLIDLYKQAGLQCLIIWGNEIYNQPEEVLKKVSKFISA